MASGSRDKKGWGPSKIFWNVPALGIEKKVETLDIHYFQYFLMRMTQDWNIVFIAHEIVVYNSKWPLLRRTVVFKIFSDIAIKTFPIKKKGYCFASRQYPALLNNIIYLKDI